MKTKIKHSILIMVVWNITLLLITGSVHAAEDEQYYKDRQKVEKATGDFNPAYFKEDASYHIIVFVEVVEGRLQLSRMPAQIRPGKMPHRPKRSNAPFRVSYFADGKEIGSYSGRDPFLVDSYDPDDGPKEGVITPLKKGIVEILLPDKRIQSIKIYRTKREVVEFKVTEKIKNAKRAVIKPSK